MTVMVASNTSPSFGPYPQAMLHKSVIVRVGPDGSSPIQAVDLLHLFAVA